MPVLDRAKMSDESSSITALRVAFDALPWSAAVLNEQGVIVDVNHAWLRFAETNGLMLENGGVGASYLAVCENAQGDDAGEGQAVAEAIRDLLWGANTDYIFEYSCHSPSEQRWFVARLRGAVLADLHWVTVVHENVTDRRKLEEARRVAVRRELQALVDARTRELLTVNQRLRDADRELRQREARLRDLTTQLFTAQEDERRRLAREFHDGFGQQIAAASIQLGNIRRQQDVSESVRGQVAGIQRQIVELSNELRTVSHELHPAALEQLGLEAALKAHCTSLGEHEQITIDCDGQGCPAHLASSVSICLFRVAQAALRNVVLHSDATRVSVSLTGVHDGLELRVTDNGRGFDRSDARKAGGLGLVSMEERVRPLGGRLSVATGPGQGTVLVAFVPLTAELNGQT